MYDLEEREKATKKAAVEAILFSMGDAVPIGRISAATGLTKDETAQLLLEMTQDYEARDRGIRLVRLDDAYQLATKEAYYDCLIQLEQKPRQLSLTDVVMETLSIIAYKQPVTKAEIEKIRGVKSDHAVNRLIEYNLVEEVGRLDAPGKPILFGTTESFLRTFGVDSAKNLPEINPVTLADFKAEAEEEINVDI